MRDVERVCEHCGQPLPRDASPRRRFCADRCRSKAYRQRKRGPVKVCSTCRRVKPLSAFTKDRSRSDGIALRCRDCRNASQRARYQPKGYPIERPERRTHHPGERFGSLVIVETLGKVRGSMRVLARCDCGIVRDYQVSNLVQGLTVNCADRTQHVDPRYQGDQVTYGTAHKRVAKVRGSAKQHECARCGQQAAQWAYSHADPDQKADETGKDSGKPYSTNPAHYRALCRPCHKRSDVAHARTSGGGISLPHVTVWAVQQE